MLDSRTEEILKSILGDEANPEPPLSRVEALLYRLGEKIGSATTFKIKGRVDSVSDLPVDAQPGDFYFVGLEGADDFDEYVMKDDHTWEHIGTTQADMSVYLLKADAVGKKTEDGGEIFNNAKSAGQGAHAENNITQATGQDSHAEGYNTEATGWTAHAEGGLTHATGTADHAEGWNTTASGNYSHAGGHSSKAEAGSSFAHGSAVIARGRSSVAFGVETIASCDEQIVEGRYNIEDTAGKFAHIIGNGTYETRSNALAIDWKGKIYVGKSTTGVDVSKLALASDAVGKKTAEGGEIFNTAKSAGISAHAEGATTQATGYASHTEGVATVATGSNAHAEGAGTLAEGNQAHSEGAGTQAKGISAHAEGEATQATGNASHSEGCETQATGGTSHAGGQYSIASGYASFAHGDHVHASHTNQVVFGAYNVDDEKYIFTLGNGTTGTDSAGQPYIRESNALAIDNRGKIYVNDAETGIDVSKLIIPTTEEEFIAMAEAGTLIPGSLYVAPEEE